MGIDYDLADTLIGLQKPPPLRPPIKSVIQIGRQGWLPSRKGTAKLFKRHGLPVLWQPPNPYPCNYSEDFFSAFGASIVHSLDISNAEYPTHVYDLNLPIPEQWKHKYDLLVDGGTLEHIFDARQAVENYINLIQPYGTIVIETAANNLLGHGFYQFSPEFFFSLFHSNGFNVDITVIEHGPRHQKFRAIPPAISKQRFETTTFWRTSVLVVATRHTMQPFTLPQQSDYVPEFTMSQGNSPWDFYQPTRLERFMVENFPGLTTVLKAVKFSAVRKMFRLTNKQIFRRML